MDCDEYLAMCIVNITLFTFLSSKQKKKAFWRCNYIPPSFLEHLYSISSNKSIPPSKDFPWLEIQIEFLPHLLFSDEKLY